MNAINQWLAAQPEATRAAIEALRSVVRRAHDGLEESIKWNAPSFALDGEDRVTLGVERRGGVRLVLHRGARPAPPPAAFSDPEGLARWPSPDRGVITFADRAEVLRRQAALENLVQRWLLSD